MAGAAKTTRAAKTRSTDEKSTAPDTGEALQLGVLNDVMGFRLRRIQNHLAKSFVDQSGHPEMKSGVFSILALIKANPGVSQTRLAQEAGIDKTALVALLDYIEDMGWAVRERAREDRRKHSLFVTDRGLVALVDLTVRAHDIEAPVRDNLTAQELAQLLALLDKLYATCFREEVL